MSEATPRLTPDDLELLQGRNYAQLVTLNPDGTPQVTVLWVDADEDDVLVNTAEGRTKDRNLRRDPRTAVSVVQDGDWYRWISITGTVVDRVTGPEADSHIDRLSRRYDDEPWRPTAGQVRVLYRIRPDRVIRYPR
jgi:PPOX class probable F420-dependent enzyme